MHTPIPPDRPKPRKRQNYKEYWTIFGPRKIRDPVVLCPGIVREGNRAVPTQRFYKSTNNRAIPIQDIYEDTPESEE